METDTAQARQLTLNVMDDDGPYTVYKIENYTVANANTFLAGLNTTGVKNSVQMEISRYPGCVSMTVVSRNTGDTGALEYLVKYNAAEQMTARNVAAIIGDVFTQVMSGQSSREMIFKMWPIAGEVVEEEKVMTREERRALLLELDLFEVCRCCYSNTLYCAPEFNFHSVEM